MRWSGSRPAPFVQQEITAHDGQMTRSESNIFTISDCDDDEVDQYFFNAEETTSEELDRIAEDGIDQSAEHRILRRIDDICPAWIEVFSNGKGYSKAFAIVNKNKLTIWPAQACEDLVQGSKRIKKTLTESFSSRLSSTERTRRALGLAFSEKEATDIPPTQIHSFLACRSISFDTAFLKRPEPTIPDKELVTVRLSVYLARAISDRHWIEEWATVSPRRISFFHPEKRKPHYHVPFSTVTGVAALPPENSPQIPDHYFLAIHTIGRTVYLMFASQSSRDQWLCDVRETVSRPALTDVDSLSSGEGSIIWAPILGEMHNPAEEFMHKSSMWTCKNRRVLNCGLFSLHSRSLGINNPLELVETALRSALTVSRDSSLANASRLKDACIQGLSEDQKLVVFLNLYHVMILHAYLVLGPPNSSLQWLSYFNNIAYQLGDDIFSLTELEHCIIRPYMSHPSQLLSRFAIPKSRYPRMALFRPCDYRINFALNCGSLSNPAGIYIYKEEELEAQLDAAARLYLRNAATTVVRKSTIVRDETVVTVPRLCQWYMEDFGGSEVSLLDQIKVYLPDQALLQDLKNVTIRFLPFKYECRPLSLIE
jgi:hypothetical protein